MDPSLRTRFRCIYYTADRWRASKAPIRHSACSVQNGRSPRPWTGCFLHTLQACGFGDMEIKACLPRSITGRPRFSIPKANPLKRGLWLSGIELPLAPTREAESEKAEGEQRERGGFWDRLEVDVVDMGQCA
jgi:hypothetical protein